MEQSPSNTQSVVRTFQAHYGLIVAAASRYAPTPDLVFDVVNEVFIDFLDAAARGSWDASRDPAPFLYTLTKNRALKQWRREKRHSPEIMQLIGEELMNMRRAKKEDLETMNESMSLLSRCLEKLPDKSRELVEGHYLREMSLESLAKRWSVSSHSLGKTLFRIRKKLRECVDRNRGNKQKAHE